jgi:hypothetical protein
VGGPRISISTCQSLSVEPRLRDLVAVHALELGLAQLELRDPSTGEVIETVATTHFKIAKPYWLEDRLLTSGLDSLEASGCEGRAL